MTVALPWPGKAATLADGNGMLQEDTDLSAFPTKSDFGTTAASIRLHATCFKTQLIFSLPLDTFYHCKPHVKSQAKVMLEILSRALLHANAFIYKATSPFRFKCVSGEV